MTYLEAIADAIKLEMRADDRVFLIGEDIGVYGGAFKLTKGFLAEFGPQRVIDAPISEAAIVGAGIGAALNGMRPIVEMQFMDFITNGFNQLVTVAGTTAYRWGIPVPIVVRGPSGGGVGANPFHSRNSEAWFVHATGLKVVCPASATDAKGLMTAAIRDPNPVVFFEHKGLYRKIKEDVPKGEVFIPLGQARIARQGTDATVVAYGSAVFMALEAAEILEKEGAKVEVVDIRTLVPFDEETVLASVKKTGRAVVAHEAVLTGGFGGEIVARITDSAFRYLDAPVRRVAAFDSPTPFAPTLEKAVLPNTLAVVDALRSVLQF
ncbi:MAG: alpha-ketoacid dehydrogenase subunit beta [Chlorobi bacterium]|nr:MAG: alpha-ketoacid dehydrogenase subunit beta [Bacteroidota bacterium]KXK35069.1 MAG: 2-oxoisovalerate dehydrogenase E1 component [Chlorobi bacterium OLB6]MBE2265579.1 alpha-ketoacid dehydrogenase subunit beta [Flavobacteriales bacterium]MBL1161721.1 alpha-ketoacid dehydrogenase subunit beta [Chlorobiota bacterium]MBW7853917.1 alpha-ketoacid dehydrogenase subunit beta [Candidatus Kapabacteria bacterium]MCC6331794.1 alpha-ketoacid dehydrogenase subunit beta [Ignavibacteria bacterium]